MSGDGKTFLTRSIVLDIVLRGLQLFIALRLSIRYLPKNTACAANIRQTSTTTPLENSLCPLLFFLLLLSMSSHIVLPFHDQHYLALRRVVGVPRGQLQEGTAAGLLVHLADLA